MENEKKLYKFSNSQNVVTLQCKYSLYKQILNVLTYAKCDEEIDIPLMKKAFNIMINRNDCMRMRFIKKGKQNLCYFLEKDKVENIPYYTFNTEKELNDFILKYRKSPLKHLKGQVFDTVFCKTPDDKFMIILKVCHLILDAYGIGNIYSDLFGVYNALKNNTELPPLPTKYEDVLARDVEYEDNKELETANRNFYNDFFNSHESPSYAGIHGDKLPLWQKLQKKGKRAMKMFFVKCDTDAQKYEIPSSLVEKLLVLCKNNKATISNMLFYLTMLVTSKINGDVKNMIQLELSNCRGTISEKKCGGTKAQSLAVYTTVDKDKSFNQNLAEFLDLHTTLSRHISFSDVEYEKMYNAKYKKSLLSTYYGIIFSFIPTKDIKGVEVGLLSNGKFVLPCYLAMLYNVDKNSVSVIYEYQKKITDKNDTDAFHKNLLSAITQVTENPDVLVKDIKIIK